MSQLCLKVFMEVYMISLLCNGIYYESAKRGISREEKNSLIRCSSKKHISSISTLFHNGSFTLFPYQ